MSEPVTLMLKAGRYMRRVVVTREGNRLFLKFGYNQLLMDEVRAMEGARWHGHDEKNPRKQWSILDSSRNRFQLAYLQHPGAADPQNPYCWYDRPLEEVEARPRRCPRCRGVAGDTGCKVCSGAGVVAPYAHQVLMTRLWVTVRQCEWAAEMGTGKTLAAIMGMELSGKTDCVWVGPKSALHSVKLEFEGWESRVTPRFYTYDALKKLVETWPEGRPPPELVVFDEASRLKNPTAQRTQAARHLAEAMRQHWGRDAWVLLMSGSPAPKSPVDWWSQCEIACPGFLREGTIEKFKKRLAIIRMEDSLSGGSFPKLVSWKDDPKKCDECGEVETAPQHDARFMADGSDYHAYRPSLDEVSHLYRRMRGLVQVTFKKDCLDLPAKIYRVVECRPSQSTLNAARAIQAKSPSAIQALTLLRELSDGFQYMEEASGEEGCPRCRGTREVEEHFDASDPENPPTPEEFEKGYRLVYDETSDTVVPGADLKIERRLATCPTCGGTGLVRSYKRAAVQVPCPKEDALRDLLDEHDEVGRVVIFAGFTGSVERCVRTCESQGWLTIRVDGRGWSSSISGDAMALLKVFQYGQDDYPRVAFVGQPGAAGMGLNLTASPSIIYYSNDFNAESRIQSEDRCHRPGMDRTRGCTIYDLCHLPSDLYVLNNLRQKRRLQDMTLGQFREALEAAEAGVRYL